MRSTPLRILIACGVICASLALPDRGAAEETTPEVISEAPISQTPTANSDRSEALLRVSALRRDLEAQVKALRRIGAYQKELLDLANTRDREAVLRARRPRQSCRQDINSAAICNALSVSFSDDTGEVAE